MKFKIVNCFCTDALNSGNKAAVLTDYHGDKNKKQEVAKEINLPVTVFLSNKKNALPTLEYFYPESEMSLCLHGTMAACQVLFYKKESETCRFVTALNNYSLDVIKVGGLIQIKVYRRDILPIFIDPSFVCQMLNIEKLDHLDMQLPFTVSSVGSPKLLVPFKSEESIFKLKPNFVLIKQWSIQKKINGLYTYALIGRNKVKNDFVARGFNPSTGHNEDAATGVAAAALALLLKQSILVRQGENLGSPCKIIINYIDDNCIFVGGNVSAPLRSS